MALADKVPTNVQFSGRTGAAGYAPCEPSIAIDPTNPDRVVAGAVLDYVYVSEDAGQSWTRDRLEAQDGVFGDPCVVAGPQGDFYYAHLSNPDGRGWETEALLDRIVVQHSKAGKGGKKWNKGAGVGLNGAKDQDKEWLAVSPSGDKLAICWTEFDHYGSELETDSTRICGIGPEGPVERSGGSVPCRAIASMATAPSGRRAGVDR